MLVVKSITTGRLGFTSTGGSAWIPAENRPVRWATALDSACTEITLLLSRYVILDCHYNVYRSGKKKKKERLSGNSSSVIPEKKTSCSVIVVPHRTSRWCKHFVMQQYLMIKLFSGCYRIFS